MLRVVVDANVFVSALISPNGSAAAVLTAWAEDHIEVLVSRKLLLELSDVLARPKFQRWFTAADAEMLLGALATTATLELDPETPPLVSPDPDDDYLRALAHATSADYLVTGDRHLTELREPRPPVLTPRQLLHILDSS